MLLTMLKQVINIAMLKHVIYIAMFKHVLLTVMHMLLPVQLKITLVG
jgi:hypothetical protein